MGLGFCKNSMEFTDHKFGIWGLGFGGREAVSSGSCLATACGSAVSVPPGSAMQPLGRAYTYQAVGTVGILRYMLSSLRLQRLCYDPVVTFI